MLIHAERGLGKTKLALEFYAWLSREDDPGHYWPDGHERLLDRVAVMPRPENCDLTARPRFLWWGLQIDDGPRPGNTILNALGDLLPHLTTVRLAARRRESVRDIAAELTDLAVELGISHGKEFLGEALTEVLGPVKTFGMTAWKIGRILRGEWQKERDPIGSAEAHVESLSEALVADLARLFDPRSRNYAGAPLVLFVDDAQFADRAEAVDHFLAELIGRATRDGWPLFLILTHWSRDRTEWVDADGTRHPPSHVARIIEHARYGLELDPGPFGGGGGRLRQGNYLEIDLGEPVDDLGRALLGRFPGLSRTAVEQILYFVAGNPRKLEQVVLEMAEIPAWFETPAADSDLTDDGLEEVLSLSRLEIDKVVGRRFRNTPEGVRQALMLAGLCGHQFLVDLVERLAEARLGAPAREGLEDGERTFRMVRHVLDRSRDAPSAFSERLFHQASRSYRTSGQARQDLAGWPDDAELDAALDAALGELVRAPESFPALRPGERAYALGLAADRFLAAESDLAWLALARLVAVENARSNYEGASAAARRFAQRPAGVSLVPMGGPRLVDAVANTLARIGLRGDAETLWRALHELLVEQVELDPGDAAWQRNLSVSYDRIGDAEMARGDRDAALGTYRGGLAIAQRLAALDPGNAGWQRGLSVSHDRIGDAEMARGDRDAALEAYRAGLAIRERLAALDSGNAGWQRDLSVSLNKIGDAEMARGERDAAIEAYRAGLAITERLAALDPGPADWQRDLSVEPQQASAMPRWPGAARGAALEAYRAGLAIAERLAALDPANAGWQSDLSVSHDRIGDCRDGPGRPRRRARGLSRRASRSPSAWPRSIRATPAGSAASR